MRTVGPFEDTVLSGKYTVPKDTTMFCGIYMIHRDPKVWGEDAEVFRPERMLDGKFEALPVCNRGAGSSATTLNTFTASVMAAIWLRNEELHCE